MWRRSLTGCCTGATCCAAVGSEEGNVSMLHNEQEATDMDEANRARINDDQFIQTSVSDVSLWEKHPKKACPERSDVIDGIVQNQKADYLGTVVEHGWDVNEMLQVFRPESGRVKRTALHHALYYRWHDGVRLLLNAGADCNIKCEWSWELDRVVPPDLKRHFGSNTVKHTPLCVAIYKDDVDMVKLLLLNGLDLKHSGCDYIAVNLERLKMQQWMHVEITQKENGEVLNELLTNSTNVRRNLHEQLQGLLQDYLIGRQFFPEQLNVIFTHGVHIDKDDQGCTLYHAFTHESPINTIRWLLRHGACSTTSLYPMLCLASILYRMMDEDDAFLVRSVQRHKLPVLELLLQVGIKPSNSLRVQLGELEMKIQAYLQQGDPGDDDDIISETANIYHCILNAEKVNSWFDRRKVFPADREQQMAHLREFSDQSLDVYPEDLNMSYEKQDCWQQTLKVVSNMLHFLNQPRTLQWSCRVCLRESLVSLSPSMIRKLPGPASLKRYILCHEL